MKVGLLGGSFDPPHNGHLALASAALRQLNLSCIYLVLSPRSPFKSDLELSPASLRLRMLKAALKGKPRMHVGAWEMKRQGPSYTIDTLHAYRKGNPKHDLVLVMGSDAYGGFPRWKKAGEILRLATIAVALRPGAPKPTAKRRVQILKGRFPDISSTELRQAFQKRGAARRLLPPAVEKIIRKKGLYGAAAR